MKETLPVTAFVVSRNGLPMLDNALKSLDFVDQLIYVDDGSWDGSVACARKYTDEIYHWYGSNSMAERRNYATGFKGNERHTPEWISNPKLKIHPEVRNPWVMYIDHDEVIEQAPGMPTVREAFKDKLDSDAEGLSMFLVNVSKNGLMTTSPLLRVFRTGTVWWEGAIQHDIKHGQPLEGINVRFLHYGYGDVEKQQRKFWDRLMPLQKRVKENPENLAHRRYLINNLCGIAGNVKHLEEATGQFFMYKDLFLQSDNKDKYDEKMLLAATVRHLWGMMRGHNNVNGFLGCIEGIMDYIAWNPDMWYFLCHCALENKDIDAAIHCGELFFNRFNKLFEGGIPGMELESAHNKHLIAHLLADNYFLKSLNSEGKVSEAYLEKAREWNKQHILLTN